jgi:ketosteroid isomerase-like protein
MSGDVRSAREVVELYNLEVYNNRNFALADELLADRVIRHEVGDATTLTRQQARQRIEDLCSSFDKLHFVLNLVVVGDDGEHVTIVYQSTMTTPDGRAVSVASMEVFHVVNGRITEVYNCGYKEGFWS